MFGAPSAYCCSFSGDDGHLSEAHRLSWKLDDNIITTTGCLEFTRTSFAATILA